MSERLRRRVLEGLEAEIELFGSGSGGGVVRAPGVVASLSPRTPERSIFNSVHATDREALAAAIDSLADTYERAGVGAWTVWVPDRDRASAELLAGRGHVLDGAPRSMGLRISDLRPPDSSPPPGTEIVAGEIATVAEINDRAYGIEGPAWAAAIDRAPELPFDSAMALVDGRPVSCAIALDRGGDACVTAVATLPEHQGRGLASELIAHLLARAQARGMTTATLQASAAGAPVYERLGFIDVGFTELWELRRA